MGASHTEKLAEIYPQNGLKTIPTGKHPGQNLDVFCYWAVAAKQFLVVDDCCLQTPETALSARRFTFPCFRFPLMTTAKYSCLGVRSKVKAYYWNPVNYKKTAISDKIQPRLKQTKTCKFRKRYHQK